VEEVNFLGFSEASERGNILEASGVGLGVTFQLV
jgi:hypothetical protein